MTKLALGQLERVELRDVWEREDHDFTPWLAEDENIGLLGNTIGLNLEVEAQEKNVGPFRADILCKDLDTEEWVLIENQLEKTDHTHLGQLMTYAAGLQAVTIVWVAAKFSEEHRAALDWLNSITDKRFKFFGIEVELWRIGDSPVAPKFNIISSPNDWSKDVKGSAKHLLEDNLTDAKVLQKTYWTAFQEYLLSNSKSIRLTKALPYTSMNYFVLGKGGFKLASVVSSWDSSTESYNGGEIRAEFVIGSTTSNAKEYYQILESQRDEIDGEFGEDNPQWDFNPDRKRCKVFLQKSVDINDQDDWDNQHLWLMKKLELLQKVFKPRVKALPKI